MDGNEILATAQADLKINLVALVARTSLWASRETFDRLRVRHDHAAWYPHLRRFSRPAGERKGQMVGDIRLDDNSYANIAAKLAIVGNRRMKNFAVCHVWPMTCYDARYHTSVANLILVPTAIAGLTDHDPVVVRAVQYRSFDLYGWHPSEMAAPVKPDGYPEVWTEPQTSAETLKSIARLPPPVDQADRAFSGAAPSDRLSFR